MNTPPEFAVRRGPSRFNFLLAVLIGLGAAAATRAAEVITVTPPTNAVTNAVPQDVNRLESEILKRAAAAPLAPSAQAAKARRLFSFRADGLPVQSALALFAKANQLNIVPDPDVSGQITVDLNDLPLDKMLEALLDAHDLHWEEKEGLIRVHTLETRTFIVDYPRSSRTGFGSSSASLTAGGGGGQGGGMGGGQGGGGMSGGGMSGGGMSGGGMSGGGMSGGGMGGGGMGGGGMGGGGMGGGMSSGGSGSSISLMFQDSINFWQELEDQLKKIVSSNGKLMVDKQGGSVQVTDRPRVIKNVELFLKQMQETIHRQVDIEVKIYEVSLNDQFHLGVDWQRLIKQADLNIGVSNIVFDPVGGITRHSPAVVASFMPAAAKYGQIAATLEALQEQGKVKTVSQPRLRALNNQTAIIKVGTDTPFFSSSSGFIAGTGGSASGTFQQSSYQTITVGTILAITPQVSSNGWITLEISPVITSLAGTLSSGSDTNRTTAPILDIKQSSSLIRVRSDETIIIGGLMQDKTTKTVRQIPVLGSIPLLGKLFQGTFSGKQNIELIIFVTARVVE